MTNKQRFAIIRAIDVLEKPEHKSNSWSRAVISPKLAGAYNDHLVNKQLAIAMLSAQRSAREASKKVTR